MSTEEEGQAIEQIRVQVRDGEQHAHRNSSAAMELSASAEQVSATAQELAQVSDRLARTVARFTA